MKNFLIIIAVLIVLVGAYFAVGNYLLGTDDQPEVADNNDQELDADPDLLDSAWVWRYTELSSGERTEAPEGERFVLTFDKNENRVFSTTDCNSMFGTYSKDGEVISFGELGQTLMYCEGSMESTYGEQLRLVNSYTIEGDTLRFNLDRDDGVMVFERRR